MLVRRGRRFRIRIPPTKVAHRLPERLDARAVNKATRAMTRVSDGLTVMPSAKKIVVGVPAVTPWGPGTWTRWLPPTVS